jgi:signal transduction histidine kinase
MAAAAGVLVLALVQWGVTDAGWTRGVSLGIALGIVVAFAVRRARRRSEQQERTAAEQRLQLAREVHDAVASQVSIIGIQAAAARRVIDANPSRAAESLQVIETAARMANADLRRMLTTLRAGGDAPTEALPGLSELPALVAEHRAGGLVVEVLGLDRIPALAPALDAAVYRIIQEALANASAHAGAHHASIALSVADGTLHVVVVNPTGRTAAKHQGSGLGLRGMRERAEMFGGSVDAGMRTGDRFVVEVTLPVVRR